MNNNVYWTGIKIVAIVLIIFLIIIISFCYFLPVIKTWNDINKELEQERTFHIVFGYNFDSQMGVMENETRDLKIDINLTYPHGTLIVDDPVNISGIAIQKETSDYNITSVTLSFQNALAYPVTQDENGFTKGQNLILWERDENKLIGNTTFIWVLEGKYYPKLGFVYTNKTGRHVQTATSPDVAITVYPKLELAQIITNSVSITLAVIIYILTIVGTGSLILSILNRKPSAQNKNNGNSTGTPQIDNVNRNEGETKTQNEKQGKE